MNITTLIMLIVQAVVYLSAALGSESCYFFHLPACLSTYLPIYLSTYLPIYRPTHLPIYLPTDQSTILPPICLPAAPTYLLPPYLLPTSYLPSICLPTHLKACHTRREFARQDFDIVLHNCMEILRRFAETVIVQCKVTNKYC